MTQTSPNTPSGKPAPATGLAHLFRAARYTWRGLKTACGESAFRQELASGVILVPLAWLLPFPALTSALLTICWLGLLTAELLNTAIEAIVDLVSPGYHELAGRAKDLGSAAVACAITANAVAWLTALLVQWMR